MKTLATAPAEMLLNNVSEGTIVCLKLRFPPGAILFEAVKSMKGNIYWRIKDIVNPKSAERLGINAKRTFVPEFINAPKELRDVIEAAIASTGITPDRTKPTPKKPNKRKT